MPTLRTFNKILGLVDDNIEKANKICDMITKWEETRKVSLCQNWSEETLIAISEYIDIQDNVEKLKEEDNMVENKIVEVIGNPDEYMDKFDELIENLILDVSRMKGLESLSIKGEMLSNIREQVIDIVHQFGYDISIPEKEYNLGDKVTLYYQQLPAKATIVRLGNIDNDSYALLIDDKYEIAFEMVAESPTNYMIELQKIINVE